ncbi:MAG: Holliday junction branch migration protein RuvA [Bacillota bacterium]
MIGYLEGTVSWCSNNSIVIENDGVGYLVEVTELLQLPPVGKKIALYIYTYVREDALKLYGFETMEERKLFKILLSVSGIGPKAAMNILSTLTYERFIKAIMGEQIAVLKEVSGIGPKTGQRLILELKNKIDNLATQIQVEEKGPVDKELFEELIGLGYSRKEIEEVIKEVDINKAEKLEDKIKLTLSYLGRQRT